ncbi:hypothetical protein BJ165DRAFT_1474560 [Panaeolus papilionaceus]|nr:hypothetical protein BJ165DRAFT_1474560 [Panaeolus papilionaceus]
MDGSKGPIHLLQILWVIRGAISFPCICFDTHLRPTMQSVLLGYCDVSIDLGHFCHSMLTPVAVAHRLWGLRQL